MFVVVEDRRGQFTRASCHQLEPSTCQTVQMFQLHDFFFGFNELVS